MTPIENTEAILRDEDITAVREEFPEFDPDAAMSDARFLRLISEEVGLTATEAYHLLHRREIRDRDRAQAAQKATEQLTAAIMSGSRRPEEAGGRGTRPTQTAFDYRRATPAERADLKQRIRLAAARGEKIYPGHE